jgi:regulator of replication initiation timing
MIGYEELYEKYQKLLDENKRLRIENENYKEQLGLALPIFDSEVQNEKEIFSTQSEQFHSLKQVTNTSSPQDKISLLCRCSGTRGCKQRNGRVKKENQDIPLYARMNGQKSLHKPRIKCSTVRIRSYAILILRQ